MISKCIKDFILIEELDVELALSTSDPGEIIRLIKNIKVNGLYFLDIELEGGYNGVEVAQSIRQYDPRGYIIFVTAYPQYLSLTFKYQVEALDYIQKTDKDTVCKRISECILNAYKKHVSRSYNGCYIFKSLNGGKISCDYKNILFFETDPLAARRIILHTKKRPYTIYGTLDKLLEELPKHTFFKCHRSFVVNLDKLTESCLKDLTQGNEKMIMPNGAECRVSARKRKDLLRIMTAVAPLSEKTGISSSIDKIQLVPQYLLNE